MGETTIVVVVVALVFVPHLRQPKRARSTWTSISIIVLLVRKFLTFSSSLLCTTGNRSKAKENVDTLSRQLQNCAAAAAAAEEQITADESLFCASLSERDEIFISSPEQVLNPFGALFLSLSWFSLATIRFSLSLSFEFNSRAKCANKSLFPSGRKSYIVVIYFISFRS